MLAIRLQRTGRSGHAQFRLIAQDSRFSPKRGRVVAYLGSYNPHTKEVKLDTEKVTQYINNGAQPSDSAAKLLRKEGIKLPGWVSPAQSKQGSTRNPDKRRSTRPAEAEAPDPAEPDTKAAASEPAETPSEGAEAESPAEPDQEASEPAAPEQTEQPSKTEEQSAEPTESADKSEQQT